MPAPFNEQLFYKTSEGFPGKQVPAIYSYNALENFTTLADVSTSGYFDKAEPKLKLDDLIYISALGDAQRILYVSGVNPVTLSALIQL